MNKVFCIGECIIDNIPTSTGYESRIGGAPFNVARTVARLGGVGCYIGKIGGDEYSDFLIEEMIKYGVNIDCVVRDKSFKTAVAFVSLDENGDRKFTFMRDGTADLMLEEKDIKDNLFAKGDVLHFGSLGLVPPSEYAHKKAILQARRIGATVSFDVNIRENLWNSLKECVDKIKEYMVYADIVKVSEEELWQITDEKDERNAVKKLYSIASECKIVIVTKGNKGAVAYNRNLDFCMSPAIKTKVVNATGAGDCFIGSILYLLSTGKANFDSIESALDFANAETSKYLSGN